MVATTALLLPMTKSKRMIARIERARSENAAWSAWTTWAALAGYLLAAASGVQRIMDITKACVGCGIDYAELYGEECIKFAFSYDEFRF